jgi:hypothetical protein
LHAPGNAYNSNAKHKATKDVPKSCQEPAKDQPYEVADEVHEVKLGKFRATGQRVKSN